MGICAASLLRASACEAGWLHAQDGSGVHRRSGGAASAGWTAYPTLSAAAPAAPGSHTGQTLWLIGLIFVGISSMMGSVNYMTTIINTHDMNSVMEIGENILYLYQGKTEWSGNNKEIIFSKNEKLNAFIFASNFLQDAKDMRMLEAKGKIDNDRNMDDMMKDDKKFT